jgi:hypothetical protein
MKLLLVVLAVLSLAVSVAEISYVHRSEPMGDIDGKFWQSSGFSVPDPGILSIYSDFYDHRPYQNDIKYTKPLQKLVFFSSDFMVTLVEVGNTAWHLDMLRADKICNQSLAEAGDESCKFKGLPSAIATNYLPVPYESGQDAVFALFPYYNTIYPSVTMDSDYYRFTEGDITSLTTMSWWMLVDHMGGLGITFFDNRSILYPTNISDDGTWMETKEFSLDERRAYIAGYFGYMLQKYTFVKSYLDENRVVQSGIYYLSYYPEYKGIWIVVKPGIEDDLSDPKVIISGKEYTNVQVVYPFIFVNDVDLEEKTHTLQIVTKSGIYNYGIDFEVKPRVIMPKEGSVSRSGDVGLIFTNLRDSQVTIYSITLENKEFNVDCAYESKSGVPISPYKDGDFSFECSDAKKLAGRPKSQIFPFDMVVKYSDNNSDIKSVNGVFVTKLSS